MNYSPLSAVVALAAMAGTAVAGPADAPAAEPPVIIAAASSANDWSGFYAGGSIAMGRGDLDALAFQPDGPGQSRNGPNGRPETSFGTDLEGTFGSVRLGYDMQSGGWVFGGLLDLGFGEVNGTASTPDDADGPSWDVSAEYSDLSMIALRAGHVFGSDGRGLIYGLIGVGRADLHVAARSGDRVDEDFNDTVNGAVLGVGAEYAVNDMMTIFAEYNHFDFDQSVTLEGPGKSGNLRADVEGVQVVRIGVNFQF